jgi:hypothetical protein
MLSKDQIRNMKPSRGPVEVNVPGWDDTVLLRYPTFKEWMDLVRDAKASEGSAPSAEQIARVVAVCLANEDGSRMFKAGEVSDLLDQGHEVMMHLHNVCWTTVLKADGMVEQAGKN